MAWRLRKDIHGQYEDGVRRVLDSAEKVARGPTPDSLPGKGRSEAISEAIEETIRGNTMREVRMALISWINEDGFGCLHLLDHTPEQQEKVHQKLQDLQGARQLVVFRFNSMVVPPDIGNNNNNTPTS